MRLAKIQLELFPEEEEDLEELPVSSGDEATISFVRNIWGHWT